LTSLSPICIALSASLLLIISLYLFLHQSRADRAPLSFPTRRSSDLAAPLPADHRALLPKQLYGTAGNHLAHAVAFCEGPESRERSEEYTSELQSRFDLVCRLLLEKKNNILVC